MASRGRGRGVVRPAQSVGSSPCGLSLLRTPIDPVGEAALAEEFGDMTLSQLTPRPNYGSQGRPLKVITNHFPLTMPKTQRLFHYEILIAQGQGRFQLLWSDGKVNGLPRTEIRDRCYSVFMEFVKSIGMDLFQMFYDRQKNLFSLIDLSHFVDQKSKPLHVDGEKDPFTVMLKKRDPPTVVISPETIGRAAVDTAKNSLNRTPLQILDLVVNQFLFYLNATKKTDYIHFGRHFFQPLMRDNKPYDLGIGRIIYEGFFKSVRIILGPVPPKFMPSAGAICLSLNVDSKKAPFFVQQPLLHTVFQTLGINNWNQAPRSPLTDENIRQLNKHLKDLRVRTTHIKRYFVMCSFTKVPSCQQRFVDNNGVEIDVATYTNKTHHLTLNYPNLPCVRKRGARGDPKGYTYFPIELCEIVAHQKVDLKKTTERQSKELIKCSAVHPEHRLQELIDKAKRVDSSNGYQQDNPFMRSIGLERSEELMQVDARHLFPPQILYRNKTENVTNGQWNVKYQKCHIPATVGDFAVCSFSKDLNGDAIVQFVHNLIKTCLGYGMNMSTNFITDNVKKDQIDSYCKYVAAKGCEFIICVMEERPEGDIVKNAVKLAEVKNALITQCVRPQTISRCYQNENDEIYKNLALKVNAKNGGINNEVNLETDLIGKKWYRPGVMFIGLDVNHPPAMSAADKAQGVEPKEPSVIGAVANCGKSISDYRGRYYLQDMRQEECSARHLDDIVKRFVNEYAENNGDRRPNSIIIYRDGVSESQFNMVLNKETMAIRQAISSMRPAYEPKLTVITVQKRHNTRFFKTDLTTKSASELRTMKAAQKNIPPGTCVDVGPVSPFMFDFYLCSHVAIQGTAKAAHYAVLLDENKFDADSLQRLSYILCHTYQRCTKSVSLPAPVYHAHHLASRGKGLFSAEMKEIDDESSSSGISSISSDGSSPIGRSRELNYDTIQTRIQPGPIASMGMIWA